jgi:DNA-binding transcriptional regulator YiaG
MSERRPPHKQPPNGYVSLSRIAPRVRADRRVLKRLWEGGEITGARSGNVTWLERRSLAAYLWSRPRCVREGCGRRVIGDGPGCHRHRRSGRRHTLSTRRKISKAQGGSGLPERTCEWCGESYIGRGARFCSHPHATAWHNANAPDPEGRRRRLQAGHQLYRSEVERVKSELALLGIDEVLRRLREVGTPRSASAIAGHVRVGLLEPEPGLGFVSPQLFSKASIEDYAVRLESYPDGRLRCWNATTPSQARSRAQQYQARHKSAAEFGRVASRIKKAGPKPKVSAEEVAEIRRRRALGQTQEHIAHRVGVTRKQVRLVLAGGVRAKAPPPEGGPSPRK